MRFPIETGRLQFLVVAAAEPLKQFEEGKPREAWAAGVDAHGELLWSVELVAFGEGGAQIIKVTVAGDPNVAEGELIRVAGLTANAWEMEGKTGLSFRAEAVQPMKPRAAEKAAA